MEQITIFTRSTNINQPIQMANFNSKRFVYRPGSPTTGFLRAWTQMHWAHQERISTLAITGCRGGWVAMTYGPREKLRCLQNQRNTGHIFFGMNVFNMCILTKYTDIPLIVLVGLYFSCSVGSIFIHMIFRIVFISYLQGFIFLNKKLLR
jgi:hypothetical protein